MTGVASGCKKEVDLATAGGAPATGKSTIHSNRLNSRLTHI